MEAIVYRIICLVNGKQYIGKTIGTIENRLQEHYLDSKNKKSKLHTAMRKYGIDNFKIEIIEKHIDESDAYDREIELIKQHDTYKNGYNSTLGGDGFTSEFMKEVWTREEYRKQKEEYLKSRWSDPSSRQEHSKKIKDKWELDDYRSKVIESQKKAWNELTCLEKQQKLKMLEQARKVLAESADYDKLSKKIKDKWKDEKYRTKVTESQKKRLAKESVRNDISESLKQFYKENPNARQKAKERLENRHKDEKYKENHKNSHNTKEYIESAKERGKDQWKNPKTRLKSFWNRSPEKFRQAWNDCSPNGAD